MKRKIIISIIGIGIIVGGIIAYFVVNDLKQEEVLKKELKETIDLIDFNNLKEKEIEKHLKRTVTKNDYKKTEEATKSYISDVFENLITIKNILEDKKITELLTAKNYQTDGPDFVDSKSYIDKTKKDLETAKKNLLDLTEEKRILSYIEAKKLDSYYIDFYKKELIGSTLITKEERESIEDSLNSVINLLTNEQKIIDFLIANKGSWQIENDQILFTTQTLINEYNFLLQNLEETASKKEEA